MGYMKASSHHRIFAIRSGSDCVEDYHENHLLDVRIYYEKYEDRASCTRKRVLLFSSFSSLCIYTYILLSLRILSEMTTPFCSQNTCEMPELRCVCDSWRWSIISMMLFIFFFTLIIIIFLFSLWQGMTELPDYNKIVFPEMPPIPLETIVPDASPEVGWGTVYWGGPMQGCLGWFVGTPSTEMNTFKNKRFLTKNRLIHRQQTLNCIFWKKTVMKRKKITLMEESLFLHLDVSDLFSISLSMFVNV